MADTYLYDDFFASDEDEGVVIPVTIKGKRVPITIRRGLSIADRNAAQAAAVKKSLKPNGQIVYAGIDEGALVEEMLVRGIKAWPFTHRDGTPVEITKETIRRLLGGAEEIATALRTIDEQGEDALAPFAPPSTEA